MRPLVPDARPLPGNQPMIFTRAVRSRPRPFLLDAKLLQLDRHHRPRSSWQFKRITGWTILNLEGKALQSQCAGKGSVQPERKRITIRHHDTATATTRTVIARRCASINEVVQSRKSVPQIVGDIVKGIQINTRDSYAEGDEVLDPEPENRHSPNRARIGDVDAHARNRGAQTHHRDRCGRAQRFALSDMVPVNGEDVALDESSDFVYGQPSRISTGDADYLDRERLTACRRMEEEQHGQDDGLEHPFSPPEMISIRECPIDQVQPVQFLRRHAV